MNYQVMLQNLASHNEIISNRNFFQQLAENLDEHTKIKVSDVGYTIEKLIPIWKGLLGHRLSTTFFPWTDESTKHRVLMESYTQSKNYLNSENKHRVN